MTCNIYNSALSKVNIIFADSGFAVYAIRDVCTAFYVERRTIIYINCTA